MLSLLVFKRITDLLFSMYYYLWSPYSSQMKDFDTQSLNQVHMYTTLCAPSTTLLSHHECLVGSGVMMHRDRMHLDAKIVTMSVGKHQRCVKYECNVGIYIHLHSAYGVKIYTKHQGRMIVFFRRQPALLSRTVHTWKVTDSSRLQRQTQIIGYNFTQPHYSSPAAFKQLKLLSGQQAF